MIITLKLIVYVCMLFNLYCLIGMLRDGDDFMVSVGEKLINAWRFIWRLI